MKIINGVKKYIAHCYDIDTGEKESVYWSMKDFELAETLCRMSGLGIIEGIGYVYRFKDLKRVLELKEYKKQWLK